MDGDVGRDRRTVERAVIMHGTSVARFDAARVLARLVRESGGWGAAYGLTDMLAPARLTPVHTVAGGPRFRSATSLSRGLARRLDQARVTGWRLTVRGADPERLKSLAPLLSLAAEKLQAAELGDCPVVPDSALEGAEGRLVAVLDALRFTSFTLARPAALPYVALELRRSLAPLPSSVRATAEAVARSLHDLDLLAGAMLGLGRALEREGRLAQAAGLYVILYELALLRCDVGFGLDAAHGAGRTFRRLTVWSEADRWYGLGLRLAEHADDFRFAARLLDGLGNTHRERGDFPAARRCYRQAARLAVVARDPVEMANVALGLMTVEREAGRLGEAAAIGLRALRRQSDPRERTNLLLNLGTLLRDGGALEVAERVYQLVRSTAEDRDVALMAQDALAYCAALRGARAEYDRMRRDVRAPARAAPPYLRAQIGYFRGSALRALGDDRAARVLRATERYARAHGLREWEVRAGALAEQPLTRSVPTVAALRPSEAVREGIDEMLRRVDRESAVGA